MLHNLEERGNVTNMALRAPLPVAREDIRSYYLRYPSRESEIPLGTFEYGGDRVPPSKGVPLTTACEAEMSKQHAVMPLSNLHGGSK